MGKQINYWLKYGKTLDIITEDKCCYYFYLPEAGTLMAQQIPFQSGQLIGYNAACNTVIEAGFSFIHILFEIESIKEL